MRRALSVGLLAATLAVAPLAAQGGTHKGFWIGFGLGGGANLSKGLDGKSLWGGNGYIRLGGTPSQQLLLGGEVLGWTVDQNNQTLNRGNVHFVAMYYPSPSSGFYLKGGIGGASIGRESHSGSTTTTTTKGGFGAGAGLGYEVKLGKNIYLVPSADFLFQAFKKETDPVLGNIPGTNSLLLFNLGLTWH